MPLSLRWVARHRTVESIKYARIQNKSAHRLLTPPTGESYRRINAIMYPLENFG